MNSSSKLFDKIRIGPRKGRAGAAAEPPRCDHPGCGEPAPHRAPKGRDSEGKFWNFCITHVREYNQSYNYFAGMPDDAVRSYQKDAMIGHRPTWKLGENAASGRRSPRQGAVPKDESYVDPFDLFAMSGQKRPQHEAEPAKPRFGPVTLRAFETLTLETTADPATIRLRYKELVKQFHPDANGGDRSLEDRLREIITAYNTLKAAGLA
jgi:DnaJ domain